MTLHRALVLTLVLALAATASAGRSVRSIPPSSRGTPPTTDGTIIIHRELYLPSLVNHSPTSPLHPYPRHPWRRWTRPISRRISPRSRPSRRAWMPASERSRWASTPTSSRPRPSGSSHSGIAPSPATSSTRKGTGAGPRRRRTRGWAPRSAPVPRTCPRWKITTLPTGSRCPTSWTTSRPPTQTPSSSCSSPIQRDGWITCTSKLRRRRSKDTSAAAAGTWRTE